MIDAIVCNLESLLDHFRWQSSAQGAQHERRANALAWALDQLRQRYPAEFKEAARRCQTAPSTTSEAFRDGSRRR